MVSSGCPTKEGRRQSRGEPDRRGEKTRPPVLADVDRDLSDPTTAARSAEGPFDRDPQFPGGPPEGGIAGDADQKDRPRAEDRPAHEGKKRQGEKSEGFELQVGCYQSLRAGGEHGEERAGCQQNEERDAPPQPRPHPAILPSDRVRPPDVPSW